MTISFSEDEKYILEKIQSYCQYQERCIKEVRNKLFSLKATNKTADKILQSLIDNDYLNEDRYAKMFIPGQINTELRIVETPFGLMHSNSRNGI